MALLPHRLLALVAATAIVAGACASSGDRDTSVDAAGTATTSSTSSSGAPSEGVAAGTTAGGDTVAVPEVLQVEAVTLGGEQVDLASLAGRDLALWFWAPW